MIAKILVEIQMDDPKNFFKESLFYFLNTVGNIYPKCLKDILQLFLR